jgi:hypothetical protein
MPFFPLGSSSDLPPVYSRKAFRLKLQMACEEELPQSGVAPLADDPVCDHGE